MFINDQWAWFDLSDDYLSWIEDQEITMPVIPDMDMLVFF